MKQQTMTPLTPDLWVVQSRSLLLNSGVFISQGQACLIDPGLYPDEIERLGQWVKDQRAVPSVILLTHGHWDHLLGPERFPGAKIMAQAGYEQVVRKDEIGILKAIARWETENNVVRKNPFVIPLPAEVCHETLRLNLGELTLELIHVPGHAADQLVAYHAASGTLWASDILSDVEIPFVSDHLAAYEKTLVRLADLDIRALVPGHGSPTKDAEEIQTRFARDRAYLSELSAKVSEAVRAGKSVAETVAVCAALCYRNPADNAFYHQLNVESAYLEWGGEADPQQFGWARDWEKYPSSN